MPKNVCWASFLYLFYFIKLEIETLLQQKNQMMRGGGGGGPCTYLLTSFALHMTFCPKV